MRCRLLMCHADAERAAGYAGYAWRYAATPYDARYASAPRHGAVDVATPMLRCWRCCYMPRLMRYARRRYYADY